MLGRIPVCVEQEDGMGGGYRPDAGYICITNSVCVCVGGGGGGG